MRFYSVILLISLQCFVLLKASAIDIRFVATFKGKTVSLEDAWYHISDKDSLQLETIRGYITNIAFYKNGELAYKEKNSYHLIDASEQHSMLISIPSVFSFDEVRFNMGVDSITNVSGALNGDLDPAKGMYWAWQSGYINFKLEGTSKLCPTRKNEFEFHLGGYAGGDKSLQEIQLKATGKGEVKIAIAIDRFLQQVDLAKQNAVMIPGKEAVALSALLARCFELLPE